MNYVATITEGEEGGTIDLEETRNSIFSEPYFSPEQDEMMWTVLSEDTEAEQVLQELLSSRDKLHADGVLTQEEYDEWSRFSESCYSDQLKQLRSISALRPIHDDALSEEEVQSFVSDHIEQLREDVQMEELVPDLEGSITAKVLFNLQENEHRFRFRTTTMLVGDEKERARDHKLFRDMGLFQANVANHEEALFEEGELGLERKKKVGKEKKGTAIRARDE